jgi:penicillin-binding protein 1C
MVHRSWFVLPPIQEYFFKSKNTAYRSLPPFRNDCLNFNSVVQMELIYPKENSRIFIPREMDGTTGNTVFELAHRNPAVHVHWHLDGDYIGTTKSTHTFVLQPSEGKHVLTLVDEKGESIERSFEVISKM